MSANEKVLALASRQIDLVSQTKKGQFFVVFVCLWKSFTSTAKKLSFCQLCFLLARLYIASRELLPFLLHGFGPVGNQSWIYFMHRSIFRQAFLLGSQVSIVGGTPIALQ